MRASLQKVVTRLKNQKAPTTIWQEPFDRDASHYDRLCHLNGGEPNPVDLVNYCLDIQYQTLQPDLFRYLLPICLKAWSKDLFDEGVSSYRAFIEHFLAALAYRPVLEEMLNTNEYKAVEEFVRDSILDRLDQENQLFFTGGGLSVYKWFYALGSFGVIFPSVNYLWEEWWAMKTIGHAIAVLQYTSCLMYQEDDNPIFTAWTRDKGGGPPELWETDGHIYNRGWKTGNVLFLRSVLTTDYIEVKLKQAKELLGKKILSQAPTKMVDDLQAQHDLLASRITKLPTLLLNPQNRDW